MSRERRPLLGEGEPEAAPGHYGCPMLFRLRGAVPGTAEPRFRCGLGWAIHNLAEAQLCMLVESPNDCWKVHPERLPEGVAVPAQAIPAVAEG